MFTVENLQPETMPLVSLSDWTQFLASHPNAHLLQTGEWGELKSVFGWKPVRVVSGEVGIQILFRKLPLGFTVGYIPKLIISHQPSPFSQELWHEVDSICKQSRAIFLKLEPDLWGTDANRELLVTNDRLRISQHSIQPPRTIVIDIKGSEDE